MIYSLNFQTNSDISFKQVEIDDLNNENCVFLDELDEDNFKDIVDAVSVKAKEVLNVNLEKQGLPAIDDSYVPTEAPTTINKDALKEEAKNKIIDSVSQAMTVAQNEGKTFTLDDLEDLTIPEAEFSVSIEGDEAILNIDGFEFRINSQFQLFE